MLKQATVEDISNMRVTKRHGKVVVTTRYYPRFLKRKLVDDYKGVLAPTKALLTEFKAKEEEVGDHDKAFEDVDYESKFTLDEAGEAELRDLSDLARTQDVYLVCHCRLGQRCHRDILLMIAKEKFDAPVGRIYLEYPIIARRLKEPGDNPLIRS
jgi:uncharacterized protein YeaO (DUF488 family)